MDIRIEKTDRAIEKAFMELRARQPLEKIRIKDLCTLAKVNKSTFYAHYEDIYELSGRLENKLIHVILDSVPNVGLTAAHTEQLTRELFHAFVQNQEAVNILFSGARQGIFANCIEKGLRDRLAAQDPTFAADPDRGILLSFCVQGCFYAFANNSGQMDVEHLVDLLAGRQGSAHGPVCGGVQLPPAGQNRLGRPAAQLFLAFCAGRVSAGAPPRRTDDLRRARSGTSLPDESRFVRGAL